jgi:hypothetical protein
VTDLNCAGIGKGLVMTIMATAGAESRTAMAGGTMATVGAEPEVGPTTMAITEPFGGTAIGLAVS